MSFQTNIFSMLYLAHTAFPHLHAGAAAINATPVNACEGKVQLIGAP